MQFFLYEIVARVVAAWLFVDCVRALRSAFVERKIPYFKYDWLDIFLDWWSTNKFVQRDVAPIRYWILMGVEATMMVGCLGVAILGWWHPNT